MSPSYARKCPHRLLSLLSFWGRSLFLLYDKDIYKRLSIKLLRLFGYISFSRTSSCEIYELDLQLRLQAIFNTFILRQNSFQKVRYRQNPLKMDPLLKLPNANNQGMMGPPVSFPINGHEGNHSRHHSTMQLVDLTHRIGLNDFITYFYHSSSSKQMVV